MAISVYADLLSEIDAYTDRSYTMARKDVWVGNAEAKFNRRLTSTYRRLTDTTLTTDSTGLASLPSGFVGLRTVTRDYAGAVPLQQVSWGALLLLNPDELTGNPSFYAIQGTSLKVAAIAEDDFSAVFDSKLTPLSDSNTTNWLLTLAPDAYLTMCLAEEALFTREWDVAAGLESKAYGMLDDIVSMDLVAQIGGATMTIRGATP